MSCPTLPACWWVSWFILPTSRIAMGPESSSKPSTTCFPGCAICLPTASITAPTCATPWPNLVTGRSRSSHAPPELRAFNSFRADGLSSEPSPGSIETADWQRTSRRQSAAPQPGFISLPHSFSSGDWRTHSTTYAILIQTLKAVGLDKLRLNLPWRRRGLKGELFLSDLYLAP